MARKAQTQASTVYEAGRVVHDSASAVRARRQVCPVAGRAALAGKGTAWLGGRLAACVLDECVRKRPKVERTWAARKPHRSPKMPKALHVRCYKMIEAAAE